MSLAGLGFASRGNAAASTTHTFRSPIASRGHRLTLFTHCRLCNHASKRSVPSETLTTSVPSVDLGGDVELDRSPPPPPRLREHDTKAAPAWRRISAKDLGITSTMITNPTRIVLNELKKKGYLVYLVGGCVRDLILKRTPKDFDVITSATLLEVRRTFSRCQIVGRRFPICHVHVSGSIVEVSSFQTSARNSSQDWTSLFHRPHDCDDLDYMRWINSLRRDFTINGLMFDPYMNLIYDYIGGFEDIKKAKVRTVIPPQTSFQEDCARILRAIRISARLNFRLARNTAVSIKNLSSSVLRLDKSRLLMEINYMLAYGSGEASLRILWKLGLLEILLPIQAAYFVSQGFRRRDKRSNMLLSLFSNLDRLLAPDRPCHSCLWVALLAFHEALAYRSRDPLVIAVFVLAVRNGGNISQVVPVARTISYQHDSSFPELETPGFKSDRELVTEVHELASSVKSALIKMTDEIQVSRAMAQYPKAPASNLVIIPYHAYQKVCEIFGCLTSHYWRNFVPKKESGIDYKDLLEGDLAELRHVFARVVFDTVYPPDLEKSMTEGTPGT